MEKENLEQNIGKIIARCSIKQLDRDSKQIVYVVPDMQVLTIELIEFINKIKNVNK